MTQSTDIKNLATALAKAQAKIKPAVKREDNPYFKSKYADLTEVWNACRDALNKNGLSITQTMEPALEGRIGLRTTLLHTSGEWISGVLEMSPVYKDKEGKEHPSGDPQKIGSCLTYARRYSLAAIVGVATSDDDANEASGKGEEIQEPMRLPEKDVPRDAKEETTKNWDIKKKNGKSYIVTDNSYSKLTHEGLLGMGFVYNNKTHNYSKLFKVGVDEQTCKILDDCYVGNDDIPR